MYPSAKKNRHKSNVIVMFHFGVFGGLENQSYRHASWLRELGANVRLVVHAEHSELIPNMPQQTVINQGSRFSFLTYWPQLFLFLFKMMFARRGTLIWEVWNLGRLGRIVSLILWMRGWRIVVVRHNSSVEGLLSNAPSAFFLRMFFRLFVSHLVELNERSYLAFKNAHTKVPMSHIPNGIDLKKFRPDPLLRSSLRLGMENNTVVFGYCGRLVTTKRIDYLMELVESIGKLQPHLRFVLNVQGEGVDEPRLRQIAASLKHVHVNFLGFSADVKQFYDSIDYLCLLSKTECDPLVVKEALSCGREVVVASGAWEGSHLPESDCVHVISGTSLAADIHQMLGLMSSLLEHARSDFSESARRLAEVYFDENSQNANLLRLIDVDLYNEYLQKKSAA